MNTILFFDDQRLICRDNFIRKYGKPEFISVFVDKGANTPIGFPTVWKNKKTGQYNMFYQGYIAGEVSDIDMITLAAVSDDGINWMPRNTAIESGIENPIAQNQLLPCGYHNEIVTVIEDPKAPENERLKALICEYKSDEKRCNNVIYTSGDSIKWTKKEESWHSVGTEPCGGGFYNEIIESFVLTVRPLWGDRRVSIIETADWKTFSEPQLIMQVDSLDKPLTEIYGMPSFFYEGYFIGFLYMYNVSEGEGVTTHRYLGGEVDCQLSYSINGVHFQRSLRTPFIGGNSSISKEYKMVFPQSCHIAEDGNIIITASTSTKEHGYFRESNCGSIASYRLRRDGFISLEVDGGEGRLATRCLYYEGGGFGINVECPDGIVTCALYDIDAKQIEGFGHEDCIPFTGDSVFWTPKYHQKNIEELEGIPFMAEIKISSGKIYAVKGNFKILMVTETFKYKEFGELPSRKGY